VLLSGSAASAQQGKAYGLDMTNEMLALAEENKPQSGLTNDRVLKGAKSRTSRFPIIRWTSFISNCVINLSGDKDRVLKKRFGASNRAVASAVSDCCPG